MSEAREKIIEAMARASCLRSGINPDATNPFHDVLGVPEDEKVAFYWQVAAPDMEAALAAIAEQGHAVVPREATERAIEAGAAAMYGKHWDGPPERAPGENMKEVWRRYSRAAIIAGIAAADIASPDPASEAKP